MQNIDMSAFLLAENPWILPFVGVCLLAVAVIIFLLRENYRRRELNKELMETSMALNAAIDIANLIYFEYYPEEHRAFVLSKYDPLTEIKEFFNYPDSWYELGLMHKDDIEESRKLFAKIDSGAAYAEAELRNWCNGSYRWFQYRMKSIYDANGKRIKVISTRIDVTLSKEVEDGYQRHLNALFLANPDTLVSCRLNLSQDKVSNLYVVQDVWKGMLHGCSTADNLFAKTAETIKQKDEREEYLNIFSAGNLITQCRNGETSVNMTCRCRIGNELHWVDILVEMVIEPKYREIDAVYHAVDVTYSRMRELLLESFAKHDYDSLAFIFGTTQRFARYSWLYPYQKKLAIQEEYGKSFLQDIGRIPMDEPEEVLKKLHWDVIINNLERYGEYTVYITQYHEDGAKRRKRIQFFYMDKEEQLILGSQFDITNVYENEAKQKEALQAALQQANAANQAKTDFLSRMSHDMRTPMNAIIGITALALDEINDPDAMVKNLSSISSASRFLLGLINDILDMTKIEDGAVELHLEPYDYEDFLENLRAMFGPLCKENGIEFIIEIGERQFYPVLMDKVRVNQIFFNVLSNAVKFTPEGGTIIYREEKVTIEGNKIYGVYSITDTGIGMSREFQKRLFEPFVQEDNEMTSSIQGTGLGLSITKRLLDLMGGSISIESQEGRGTKVIINLAGELASLQEEEEKEDDGGEAHTEALKGKRVLLVEDHPLNTEIAKRLLEKKGLLVTSVENGKMALEHFGASELFFYDVILMDVRMPVMDGITAAKKIRELSRPDAGNIPIIAMTANAYTEDVQKTKDAGMDIHLAKPIEPERLYQTLAEQLAAVSGHGMNSNI